MVDDSEFLQVLEKFVMRLDSMLGNYLNASFHPGLLVYHTSPRVERS